MDLEALSWIGGITGAATGILALVVSVHFTRRATRAAETAAASVKETAELEAERRNAELTPHFVVSAMARDHGSNRVVLTLALEGPAGLPGLDEVVVRIRSDQPPTSLLAGSPSQQQMADTVWGPYRLVPGVDQSDKLGQTAAAFALRRGERHKLELEPSLPPTWTSADTWASRYDESPIQLELLCARASGKPWTLLLEVDQPQATFDAVASHRSGGSIVITFTNVGNAPASKMRFTDNTGTEPHLEGQAADVVRPGEVTQQVWISDTYEHITEWVELSWTDMRGARQSLKARLPD
ncbi:hypothetical protein ACQPYA_03920 [Micromonospora sp. CA-263727]|uniref:hypothetical protein n=1 Tax=Micromonospora sp. CA-263727 TaxID=3239967 RepID=UPI003D8F8A60